MPTSNGTAAHIERNPQAAERENLLGWPEARAELIRYYENSANEVDHR